MRPKKLKVINLFGAPGVGKSGTRAGLFWLMKCNHFSVEEVYEFAKYLVLNSNTWPLAEEQMRLFSEQHHRQLICERSGYEFAISDSPLHLSSFYAPEGYYQKLEPLIDEAYNSFDNYNFFLTRDVSRAGPGYEAIGRVHTQDQNPLLEQRMRTYLLSKRLPFTEVPVNPQTIWKILEAISPCTKIAPPPSVCR
jgi:hypothetical protein